MKGDHRQATAYRGRPDIEEVGADVHQAVRSTRSAMEIFIALPPLARSASGYGGGVRGHESIHEGVHTRGDHVACPSEVLAHGGHVVPALDDELRRWIVDLRAERDHQRRALEINRCQLVWSERSDVDAVAAESLHDSRWDGCVRLRTSIARFR